MPIGPIREHPQTRAFMLDLMREVVAVGRAHGVDIAQDAPRSASDWQTKWPLT
jgi:2-dehydropantoate 2-reductase